MALGSRAAGASPAPRRKPFRVPESFISDVNDRADILELVGRSVKLKKSGANYLGLCPFHSEKSPSFTVAPQKGFYKCFGCGAAGNALSWLMEHDGMPFRDALRELAASAGLALPAEMQETGGGLAAPQIETGPLFDSMERSAKFFRHVLRHSPQALEYLKGRGVTAEGLKRFLIGYAPDEWRGLKEAFPDYEKNPFLALSGMVREKDGGKRYDTFRNRITFGVRDTRGRIVAFGGRIIGDGDPKYLNSPESPIFNKSGALFGLFEARESIRTKKMALVVEGYMDVLMLAQHGVHNVVASMGTAFTRWHLERLLTQTECIVFAFDGDAAGRTAAWRALESVIGSMTDELDVRFLILPQGKDPDELVQEEGQEAFEARVTAAPSLSQFLISELSERNGGLATPEQRARFAAEASLLAGKISYRSKLRALLLQHIAQEARVPGSTVEALNHASQTRRRSPAGLWQRLRDAALTCPQEAALQFDVLADLLDPDDLDEMGFLEALKEARASGEPDRPDDPAWLVARDTMRGAIDLVVEYRQQQEISALKARFAQGAISEEQFIAETLRRRPSTSDA